MVGNFPPFISGGLGVACYAIVKELAKKQIELSLILPQTVTTNQLDQVTLFGCNDLGITKVHQEFEGIVEIKYPRIAIYLSPYVREQNLNCQFYQENMQDFFLLLSQLHLPEELREMARLMVAAQVAGMKMTGSYKVDLLTEVFRYALFAGSLAKEIPHDLIYAHDWLTILAALEAKHYSHRPLVLHIHALETDRSGFWVDKRIFAIEKYGMEQADQIIAVSHYTKNNIVRYYGIPAEKIKVVHNGIYIEESSTTTRKVKSHKMVLFLGRITQQKGPCFFIEMAKRMLAKKPEVQFVLVGTGDLLVEMIEKTASLRIGKNVHFTGFLDSERVKEIYALADVYMMPSVSEPFGLSALEALAYQVPAVIAKQAGVAEVLHHTLVDDFWDTEDLAAKILALLEYRSLRETSLAYARDDLQRLTWDKAADKIIDIYNQVLKR